MSEKKIIAVMGATGAQGKGLVKAILSDRRSVFSVRALTRNPNSDKGKELAALGAEVVACDISNAESVQKGFRGAYGAYCVTFFWDHFSPEKEVEQAGFMASAAKKEGLKHVIWSTLEDTRKLVPLSDKRMPTLMEKYKVPHFDGKGEANRKFADLSVPTTYLLTSFYWDNFIYFGMGPKKGADGKYSFALPMGNKKLPGIAAGDIGKCAYGIFKGGNEFIGKTLGIASEHLTGAQMAAVLSKVYEKEIQYQAIPFDVYRSFDFPGAQDLGNMFQYKHDFEKEFCGARNLDQSRSLNPELKIFEQWVRENKKLIPME